MQEKKDKKEKKRKLKEEAAAVAAPGVRSLRISRGARTGLHAATTRLTPAQKLHAERMRALRPALLGGGSLLVAPLSTPQAWRDSTL